MTIETRREWVVTFKYSSMRRNQFYRVVSGGEGLSMSEAMEVAQREFPDEWSMIYRTRAEAGVDEYELVEVATT